MGMNWCEGYLVKRVSWLPNDFWRIETAANDEHPGACVNYSRDGRSVNMLQGTSKQPRPGVAVSITPNARNGLTKKTHFILSMRVHYRESDVLINTRRSGTMSDSDLAFIRRRLERKFGRDTSDI